MENIWDFCHADPDFYEMPGKSAGSPYRAAAADAPEGWSKSRDGMWTYFLPAGVVLPEQGWKVHVSVTPDAADAAIEDVVDYCTSRALAFKFLTSPRLLLLQNGKYAPRGGSGKLVTIYPADEAGLLAVLTDVGGRLAGLEGPYVLGDLRWRDGPLYVRFGGFLPLVCTDAKGREVPAIREPGGRLVPDIRGPVFAPPEWAPLPAFLAEAAVASPAGEGATLPFAIDRALHFSNGGGIYLAHDPCTGDRVVLREARPHAGLDGAGYDAVSRLYHEADILRALDGLDFVPRLIGTCQVWEHHYLVEEYFDGETLWNWMAVHNPVTGAGQDDVAGYTETVLGMLDQLDDMLTQVHERGIVYADLHPRNVLVRPNGRLALVDFEISYRPGSDREPAIGCPGFQAAHARSGQARDRYALDCLRVALFLPLTVLLDDARIAVDDLVDAVAEVFPVPRRVTAAARVGLRRPGTARTTAGLPHRFSVSDATSLRTLVDDVADMIVSVATPQRSDRLFPGDPRGLTDGGYNLAYGAAGVLAALRYAGRPVDPEHVDWLARATRRSPARAGLFDGLAGTAVVLAELGRPEQAYDAMDRAVAMAGDRVQPGLFTGLAGVALATRHFARSTGDTSWIDREDELSLRLADLVYRSARPSSGSGSGAAGLLHGWSGAATYFLLRYTDTAEETYLDAARQAIEADLARCAYATTGALLAREGGALLPYLGIGTAGLAGPLRGYLRWRPGDERLAAALDGVLAACEPTFTIESGLFAGRAGLLLALAGAGRATALGPHVRRLGWHGVRRPDGIAFPGRWLLRLSTDLGTGSAGVLLALCATERTLFRSGSAAASAPWLAHLGLPLPEPAGDAEGRRPPQPPGQQVRREVKERSTT